MTGWLMPRFCPRCWGRGYIIGPSLSQVQVCSFCGGSGDVYVPATTHTNSAGPPQP